MQDTPPPSAPARAMLAELADAAAEHRRGHARVLEAVAALHAADVIAETGHRSLARLIEEHARVDPGDARRLVTHAQLLAEPEPSTLGPREPILPATAAAANDGDLGAEHITVIAATMTLLRRLPHLGPEVVTETETQLAGLARARTPIQLGHAAEDILDRLDPDGAAPPDADRPAEELRMHTGRDGTLSGRFRFADPEAAEVVRAAIEARTPPPDPDADTTVLHPGRELHERRGEALRTLAADATDLDPEPEADPDADAETDPAEAQAEPDETTATDQGARRRDGATVMVTVPLEVLESRARDRALFGAGPGAGLLEGRWSISAETARRLACDAAVVPVVLGSRGEVLDLGRRTRVVTAAQRRAVIARDRHCAHPGCRRRPRRCHVHHLVPWARGGPTDLENLVLLCAYHHHLAHHSGWEIHMTDGIPTFVPPAWLDPLRVPRTNRPEPTLAGRP